jgi:hypothetical protein
MSGWKRVQQIKNKLLNDLYSVFPTIPKEQIAKFVEKNAALTLNDFITHFMEKAEPANAKFPLEIEMAICQGRTMAREKKKNSAPIKRVAKESPSAEPASEEMSPEVVDLMERVVLFEIETSHLAVCRRLSEAIGRLRREKKRQNFTSDDFLTKIAFVYAEELKNGYISLDSDEWNTWLKVHPDKLGNVAFYCGFVPQLANPIASIVEMLQREPSAKKVVMSSGRWAGIGNSVSRKGSVFFVILVADLLTNA